MKVLVTGSRNWSNRHVIGGRLDELMHSLSGDDWLMVLHGDADGADRLARNWARLRRNDGHRMNEHGFPAKWRVCAEDCPTGHRKTRRDGTEYCPTAGHRRNAEMVALGPDLCIAFVMPCADERCRKPRPHWSHGADDCAHRAEAAGIPTVRVGPGGQEVGR